MPRFNNDGRTNKFLHMGGGKSFDQERLKLKFTLGNGGIQRRHKFEDRVAYARLDAAGDTVMEPGDFGASGSRGPHVHFAERGGGRGRRSRNNRHRQHGNQPKGERGGSHEFGMNWHKILIYNGKAYDKSFILSSLAQICSVPFIPICFSVFGANTAFYVEQRVMAEALAECSGKITSIDGQTKINLRVLSSAAPPTAHIDEECETKIKEVLGKRCVGGTLTLENFYMSPELVNDYFLPLYRASVVNKIHELLKPYLDSIIGLDLSNNRIPALDGLSKLINQAGKLTALNLKDNRIRDLKSLDRISCPGLTELILQGNPVCDEVEDREAYTRSNRTNACLN